MFKGQPTSGLPKFPSFRKFSLKLALGVVLLTFLTGYQPTLGFPLTKQSVVNAQETKEQSHTIAAQSLPFNFQELFPGYLSQHFSNWHKALDIATGLGMPIKPITGGTVTSATFDWFGYGLKVEIDHGNGYKSLYAHMGKIYVKEGQNLVEKLRLLNSTPRNTRLKALFGLLAFQGLRQIEIIRLNVSDLDLLNQTAFIRGKGQDDRELIYLHPETVKTLKLYLKTNHIADGALFKSLGNRKSERITTMTIKRDIKSLLESLGIDKTTHGFRHFYITSLLKKLDVRDARKFSRHKNIEMLIVYDDEIDIKHKTSEVFACFSGLNVT